MFATINRLSKGTRVLVSDILGALASGETIEEVLEDYPNITREDIYAALDFWKRLQHSKPMHRYLYFINFFLDENFPNSLI